MKIQVIAKPEDGQVYIGGKWLVPSDAYDLARQLVDAADEVCDYVHNVKGDTSKPPHRPRGITPCTKRRYPKKGAGKNTKKNRTRAQRLDSIMRAINENGSV